VTIVRKGPVDMIASLDTTYQCDTQGGLKRVGGQGDILSGLIACFLSWREAYHQSLWQ
jgi:ATP-dependent NAD(P)H-hydrate dehydratase